MSRSANRSVSVAAALVAGALAGMTLLGSAGAHVTSAGHLWQGHIKPKADGRYVNERVFRVSVPWQDFTPRRSSDPFQLNDFRGISGGTGTHTLQAPVLFPHKATITSVACHFYDASPVVDLACILRRAPLNAETVEGVGSTVFSAGSAGFQSATDPAPTNSVVANNNFTYFAQVEPVGGDWQGDLTTIKAVVVKYTVN